MQNRSIKHKKRETIHLLSPITVISLKAIDLSNRGWNVVTPSDRMLSIILAESEHLDNLGYTRQLMQASLRSFAQDLDTRYKVLAYSEVVCLAVTEGVASLHPRLLKLSPSATTFYTVNKHILSTRGQQVYSSQNKKSPPQWEALV